ncbi:60S ribosomal protein L7A [Haplosporangium sp. Z 27]|nr:60S ribosomal protein L7A [Haplosporangium sp. Z 27]
MARSKNPATKLNKRPVPYSSFVKRGAQAYQSIHHLTENASVKIEPQNKSQALNDRILKWNEVVQKYENPQRNSSMAGATFNQLYRPKTQVLEKKLEKSIFALANKYRPETKAQKKQRLMKSTAGQDEKGDVEDNENCDEEDIKHEGDDRQEGLGITNTDTSTSKADASTDNTSKVYVLKHGLNHISVLIQQRRAKLVLLADDVEPPNIAQHMSSLCRRNKVPFCIVHGKARLGNLINKKSAPAVAFAEIKPQHVEQFNSMIKAIKEHNDQLMESRKKPQPDYHDLAGIRADLLLRMHTLHNFDKFL